jgi:DNA-directed RNA polymerase subunit RPC12/RpoP
MALIKCPECKKEVSDSALACPHCEYKFKEDKKQVAKPKKKGGCFTNLSLIIVALVVCSYVDASGGGNSTSLRSSYPHNKFAAYRYAEKYVKQKLKSPSTAKFPSVSEKDKHTTSFSTTPGVGKYKIESWVDSQNSFGATVRTKFSCIMVFEDDKVRCEQLKFNE